MALLPPGHVFCPCDEVLIQDYLRNTIFDQPVPIDAIPTIDVYGYPDPEILPHDLFRYRGGWGIERRLFFTTRPKHKGIIVTSQGYWNEISNEKEEEIIDGGKVIGFCRKLQFVYARPETREIKFDWFIHEYRVNPSMFKNWKLDDTTKEKISTTVVCKVTLKQPEGFDEMMSSNDEEEDEPQKKKMKI